MLKINPSLTIKSLLAIVIAMSLAVGVCSWLLEHDRRIGSVLLGPQFVSGEMGVDGVLDLLARAKPEHEERLSSLAANIESTAELYSLGNGIEALESVPTAIACFSLSPNCYIDTIANAIFLGGDTDTIAAMAGAISGAFLGDGAIPRRLVEHLESSPKGGAYISKLAERLCVARKKRS